jgi:hypothetical protein
MNRKTFIFSILGALGISGVAFWSIVRQRKYNSYAIPEVLSSLTTDTAIKKIGVSYLERYPDERSERKLLYHLGLSAPSGTNLSTLKANTVHDLLLKQIEADFLQGRMCIIEGWVLSRTEARQCALFSLYS